MTYCSIPSWPSMLQQEAEAEAEARAQTEAEHVIVTPRLNRLISAEDENMVKVRLSL